MTSFFRYVGKIAPTIIGFILVIIPFHAFLSVWLSQLVGHYTIVRLWKEFLLLPLVCSALYIVIRDATMRAWLIRSWVVRLSMAYIAVQVLRGGIAYIGHDVTLTALGYGLVSNIRYLIFFLVVLIIASYRAPVLRQQWQPLVFWPLVFVATCGLLQYFVLPYDVMRHFGYSKVTIFPYEDINSNLHYVRIMSTLRGANPLGVYMVATLSLVCAWRRSRQWWWYVLLVSGLVTLTVTFSRGAWIGLMASLAVLAWAYLRGKHVSTSLLVSAILTVGVLGLIGSALYHNTTFQNVLLHTQAHSTVHTTSDQGHASALRNGLHDIMHQPLGRGPGTAGPASAYNTGHPVRIAENYFIQIAQETGWIGILLFVVLQGVIGTILWRQRQDTFALGLCAGLVGISVASLFSHAWADDTLAYLWWGLAALALGPVILPTKAEQSHVITHKPSEAHIGN